MVFRSIPTFRSLPMDAVDQRITAWLARYSILLLRIGLGIVFLWFGVLKFFPGASPAQDLAVRTIGILTFDLLPPDLRLWILATWECLIGLGFISGRMLRTTLVALVLQMGGTITPLILFPGETFLHAPYAPTLEGQYIIKNIVLIAAGLVIGATVRGGRLVADPDQHHADHAMSTTPARFSIVPDEALAEA
jgi:uncharacterized membrane protein YphA (DoxX/SURF4 family)